MQGSVEDTKGGKQERGRLMLTTMRVLWMSDTVSTMNLSIGLANVQRIDFKGIASRRGARNETSAHTYTIIIAWLGALEQRAKRLYRYLSVTRSLLTFVSRRRRLADISGSQSYMRI